MSYLILSPNCVSSNGNINLNINGGVGPYSFDWSDGSYSQDLTNVSVGTYSVIVMDSNLCKDTLDNLQITDYSPLNISSVVVPETMAIFFDGSIDITINGGVLPFSL